MEKTNEPSKCAVCDSYNFQGMWKCECDAMNLSKRNTCWKCGKGVVGTGARGEQNG